MRCFCIKGPEVSPTAHFKLPLELDSFEEYSPNQPKETVQQLKANIRFAAKEMTFNLLPS